MQAQLLQFEQEPEEPRLALHRNSLHIAGRIDFHTKIFIVNKDIEGSDSLRFLRCISFRFDKFAGFSFLNDFIFFPDFLKRNRLDTRRRLGFTVFPFQKFLPVTGNWA